MSVDDDDDDDDEYEFMKADVGFYNEIIGYKSVVDYNDEFQNLNEQTKIDLQREVVFLYNYFTNDSITTNSSIILDTNNRQICNLLFDIDLYIYETSPTTHRIGVQIFLRDNTSYQLQHLAYIAPINLKNIVLFNQIHIFKQYLYNILFYIHIFCQKFTYHPMLIYMYHQDDILIMGNIKFRRSRLFGDDDSICSVCLEQTVSKTPCNHDLCHSCFSRLKIKLCPLCRVVLENQYLFIEPE
jgi:hypothetical protein